MANDADGWVIDTHDLSKSYGGLVALKNLDLKVPKNWIFGLVGPKGAGKTTVIRLLLGLLAPTAGSGTVLGLDIVRDSLEIRKRVGYLAEEPFYHENMVVCETLRFALRFFHGAPHADIEARVRETLELVDLAEEADRRVENLSHGERQRLGIGQAQVNQPDLLVLDEPAANLDPTARRDVLRVLERLRTYTTILYSTHVWEDLLQASDTVGVLNHGQLVAQASIEDLLAGRGGTVFSMVIRGDPSQAHNRVVAQPWVSGINVTTVDDQTKWHVRVSDDKIAEEELLRLVLTDERVAVTEFGRLEDEPGTTIVSLAVGRPQARNVPSHHQVPGCNWSCVGTRKKPRGE